MAEGVKIYLVEDHQVVRKGLTEMLKQNSYDICGESVDIENAFDGILDSTPDLVILDLSLGGENGVDSIKKMKKNKNKTPVLVFSMHEDSFHVQQAITSDGRVTVSDLKSINFIVIVRFLR